MKNRIILIMWIGLLLITFFTGRQIPVEASTNAVISEFDEFPFKSYSVYDKNSLDVNYEVHQGNGYIDFSMSFAMLNPDKFYVFVCDTYDDDAFYIGDCDDALGPSSGDFVSHRGYSMFQGTYLNMSEYYQQNYKNATTDFIFEKRKEDFSPFLFKAINKKITFSGNVYSLGEAFVSKAQLYEFSMETDLDNILKLDDSEPVISGNNYYYVVNYDQPILFTDIVSNIYAIDNVDGNLTNQIEYSTQYPKNSDFTNLKVQSYNVNATVTDSSNNTSSFDFTIRVEDVMKPVINGTNMYNVKTYTDFNVDTITAGLTATDNYDGDISNKLQIVTNTLSGNEDKVGNYVVEYNVLDSSQNLTNYIVNISVTDGKAPTIIGSDKITSTIGLPDSEILGLYEAIDDVDGDISRQIIIVSNSCVGDIIGNYQIVISVSDSAGNVTTKTILYEIYDDKAPVFWVNGCIKVDKSTRLSELQIKNIIIDMGKAAKGDTINITSEYFNDETPSGDYIIIANIIKIDGTTCTENITLSILAPTEDFDSSDGVEEKKSNYQTYLVIGSSIVVLLATLSILIYKKKH